MNNFFPNSTSNSRATYQFLTSRLASGYPMLFSDHSQFLAKMQSPAVTQSGHLWQRALAQMVNDATANELSNIANSSNTEQNQRRDELIQLLRSWREGDQQEQRETWEYLRQALDTDRLSDRKLFP